MRIGSSLPSNVNEGQLTLLGWRAEGWLCVAAVVDLFSHRVVGWSISATMTAQLVTDALIMAIWRRGKPDAHVNSSDQGSRYSSEQFQRLMKDNSVKPVRQLVGQCRDGKLLLIPQSRADQEEGLPIARPSPNRCVRFYREI